MKLQSGLKRAGKTIASLHAGRSNNFNLIRFLAALTVLVAHSYPLAGAAEIEPLRGRFGMSIGTMAVDVFFVTSGFLVTESLLRTRDAMTFITHRALRIYPALIVSALIVTYLLGPVVTTARLGEYFQNSNTHHYFLKSATLLTGIGWVLPGVFETNPFRAIVNGSLWTLPYEIEMYGVLLLLWLAVAVVPRSDLRLRYFVYVVGFLVAVCALPSVVMRSTYGATAPFATLAYMFFSGSILYLLREQVSLSWVPVLLAGLVALPCVLWRQTSVFQLTYAIMLPYVVIFVALVPSGKIRLFNRLGDYSYGLYIYAFPIQQAFAHAIPGIAPRELLFSSVIVALLVAVASWHLIERPALVLKYRL